MHDLLLTKVKMYEVWGTDDERGPSKLKGIYVNKNLADKNAEHAGWYGGPGDCRPAVDLYTDANGKLFRATPVGYASDDEEGQRKLAIERAKAKLTSAELKLLGIE